MMIDHNENAGTGGLRHPSRKPKPARSALAHQKPVSKCASITVSQARKAVAAWFKRNA